MQRGRRASWIVLVGDQVLSITLLGRPVSQHYVYLNHSLRNTTDYFGLNYYTHDMMAFNLRRPGNLFSRRLHAEGVEMSDGSYGEVYPEGLYRLLKRVTVYEKPIYITENGLPDNDDDQRPRFLITHLASIHRAISEGVPVRGYFHWSLVDNFEWAEGWSLRFGLIELDPKSQVRMMRRSGELYAEICEAGTITEDMVARYAPEVSIRNIFGEDSMILIGS